MKRILATIFALIFVLSFVVACGADEPTPAQEAAGNEAAEELFPPTDLTVWTLPARAEFDSSPRSRVSQELFESQFPGSTVSFESRGRPEQLLETLNVAMSAGNPPDIFWSNVGATLTFFIDNDMLVNLDGYAAEFGWLDAYPQAVFDHQRTFFGGIYALPDDINLMGLWYKRDIFERFGLSEPETYDELIETLHFLNENDIIPIANAGRWPAITTRVVDSIHEMIAGPELRDALLTGRRSFDSPEVIETFEVFLRDWIDNGFFQEGHLSAEETEVFMLWYPSRACFWFSGGWELSTLIENEQDLDDYGFMAFPAGTGRAVAFGNGHAVASISPNVDAAIQFLNIYSSLEVQRSHQEQFGTSDSARIGAVDMSLVPEQRQTIGRILEEYGHFVPTNELGLSPEMTDAWFEALDLLILGQTTPEEAARRLDQQAIEFGWYRD